MKTATLLCLVFALVYGQIIEDSCSTIRDERTCATTQKCSWSYGVACDGSTVGYCKEALRACLPVVTCAMENSITNVAKPFTFRDSCIPNGWVRVNSSLCTCTRPTCDPACGRCETCSDSGVCVSNAVRRCSRTTNDVNMMCPPGYECQESDCRSVCVPSCSNPVQCFADPCQTPRPRGCSEDAICVPDYCGGCNRKYYDPTTGQEVCNECQPEDCGSRQPPAPFNCSNGELGGYTGKCIRTERGVCAWEYKECKCSPVTCRLYCEYGFKTGRDGCPICECNDPPCTSRAPCEAIECPDGQRPVIRPGECCPKCVDRCEAVMCPAVACEQGQVRRIPPGECCPICLPQDNCTGVRCPQIAECEAGFIKVKRGCCEACEPQVPCRAVICPQIRCAPGYKPVVPSGECCPVCQPVPDCNTKDFMCPAVACQPNTRPVQRDLTCCPTCEPDDRCATVLCAQPNCSRDAWIIRRGECCPQCPQCRDRTDGRQLCNGNDDPVCRAGYARGENCSVDVPPASRREIEIILKLCKRPSCEKLTPQEMRLLLARSSVDESRIFVTELGQDDRDPCCYRYKVTISAESNDGYDVETGRTAVENYVDQNPDLSMEEEDDLKASSASLMTLSAVLFFFSAILFL